MTYTVRILANAQRDLTDIEAYYDEEAPLETDRCLDAIEAAFDWLTLYAHQPPEQRFGLRRVSTRSFRYNVWYRLRGRAVRAGRRGLAHAPRGCGRR